MENKERVWTLLARKLANEATPAELAELSQLTEQDTAAKEIAGCLEQEWNRAPDIDEEFLEATYLIHQKRMKENGMEMGKTEDDTEPALLQPEKKIMRMMLFSALAVLTLGGVAWLVWPSAPLKIEQPSMPEARNEIVTRNASRTRVVLPDGSVVWMNADSKLRYNKSFGNTLREVYLTGEAFFDVTKNPDKPFVIHTHLIDVKVLGTLFNVRSYPNDKTTETSLVRGRVQVTLHSRPDEKYFLKPNEKLVVLNTPDAMLPVTTNNSHDKYPKESIVAIKNLTYQRGDSTAVETAWTRNKLCFVDEPFEEVAQQMGRWYDVEFEFKNETFKEVRLKGSFKNETLPQAMEALKFSTNFHYEIREKKVTIY